MPRPVDLYSFDESYLRRLQGRDSDTETHFVAYFGDLLRIKLRSRLYPTHAIDDIKQETFIRVLASVREGKIRQAERLGSFVNSVCNNVRLESYRELSRSQHLDGESVDVADPRADLEEKMLRDERIRVVRAVLAQLSERDRNILCAVLEERDKEEICSEFGIERGYLRVLLHRAKKSFKASYKKKNN